MKGKIVDISRYTSLFHDGTVVKFHHSNDHIQFVLFSAEVQLDDIQDDVPLREQGGMLLIKGILHLKKNISILEDRSKLTINELADLMQKYDSGEIHHFKISNRHIDLQIHWTNFPPKADVSDFSNLKIDADEIYWENNPTLTDLLRVWVH